MTSHIKPVESCDAFADALSDFLERDVSEPMRAAMESHALACNDCGPLLADLRKLRLDAANLPELAPSRDLWSGIAARIETPVVELGSARMVERPVRRTSNRIWTGLAAAALVGVTASTTYLLTKRANDAASPSVPAATVATLTTPDTTSKRDTATTSVAAGATPAVTAPAVTTPAAVAPAGPGLKLASNKLSAEATYDLEISRLRKIVDRRRGDLDSSTVVVLEKNLKIIDDAIAQCRMALKKDPASAYLNESLTDALDNKVQLLRAAAGLPVRM